MPDSQTKNRSHALGKLNDLRLFKEFSYINGEWVSQRETPAIAVHDPADGTLLGTVPSLGRTRAGKRLMQPKPPLALGLQSCRKKERPSCANGLISFLQTRKTLRC